MEIRKVAVIGAGVMGAGIAAQVANAGVPVVLLDIVPEGSANRNAIAEGAVKKMLKTEPAAFMHKKNARLVTTGNIEDHLDLLADCDWIIEAVIERLDIKQGLYQKLESVRHKGAIISSNTSSIPLKDLVAGRSDAFAHHFLITHFFNPPRYMRLLEVTTGEQTHTDALAAIREFCDLRLGKGVIDCKDTPAFIANRIGIFWIQIAVLEAMKMGLTVEEADAVLSRPVGIPKTGVFGLLDLIGIDLMPHLMESMSRTLPEGDAFHAHVQMPELIQKMIANGYTGRKGKGGFYRLNRSGGQKVKESIHLETGEYSPSKKASLYSVKAAAKGGIRALLGKGDKGSEYAWRVLSAVFHYTATLAEAISHNLADVDQAMRLGFNWKFGPFELMDQLGAADFAERLQAEERPIPALLQQAVNAGGFYQENDGQLQHINFSGQYQSLERPDGVLMLADIKRVSKPVLRSASSSVWDIGDGVLCLEFHSKMNALDPQILEMAGKAAEEAARNHQALVIYNEGSHFSAGANLGLLLFAANIASWQQIEAMVRAGQDAYRALKYTPVPVVGAPSGMALGGGCEILLHCDAVQAHAETYVGLVEVGVGLIPGWGGCKELLQRWSNHPKRPGGPMPPVMKSFETISIATVAKSAQEARDHLFLRPHDGITMNRDRLLADAKAHALKLALDYQAPEPQEITLPGPTAMTAMTMAVKDFRKMGRATEHDEVVSLQLAYVLSGGDTDMTETVSEERLYELEREAFMQLLREPGTLARVEHMMETGKPLRN